ncbi:MAG: hypothetical protein Q9M97_10325 [Candidatus Gracilibacteria bacterium]|nr:hypothetical protein [Candidatus Gracilibacteria bacterium]
MYKIRWIIWGFEYFGNLEEKKVAETMLFSGYNLFTKKLKMKKYIIIFVLSLLLVSCGKTENEQEKQLGDIVNEKEEINLVKNEKEEIEEENLNGEEIEDNKNNLVRRGGSKNRKY